MVGEELKSIRIKKDVHKKLKIFCSENDIKINSFLEDIIIEKINKNKLENDIDG